MSRPRIVVVGGGFAGVECLHRLEKKLAPAEAELTLVTPTDYQLYLPLLPHVAAGVLTPQSVAVSLRRRLRRTRLLPGVALGVDTAAKVCVVRKTTGELVDVPYDQLVLTAGSTTRTFDIPGLSEYALGMKTLAQAAYLRDHVISQLDLAAVTTDPAEREARLRFIVVGGGYAGTETAACLQRLTTAAASRYPRLDPSLIEWHLVDVAPKLLPELGDRLGMKAMQMLRRRGVLFSLGTSVSSIEPTCVTLTDGRVLPSHTLIWTAGVKASPLVDQLSGDTLRGRLVTTAELTVPGLDGVLAAGDAAAVPDLSKGGDAITPPTAQHAQRQGKVLADNAVARLRGGTLRPYFHKDLGLVVDLGGKDAVSKPLGVELSGVPAQAVARGYHVMALPTVTARTRVLVNWALNATAGDDFVRTGFQTGRPARLQDFEQTDAYLDEEQLKERGTAA
ncbi:NAD(P)/FAD-dependent oxidoreductase [Yinghuangia seranimata]|uniref:NAD(P)/FAD-dependent oxidoreductase n=1 Tax=Yinghuangia seranimata TaxID=408067 RepID=UPI00248C5134|nr:FAD-dependent oxidoreductase [Yinghuangia seranimata]MDI2131124.1 FAD-dependent oxidoreductase [Yinghuangia seranimata]